MERDELVRLAEKNARKLVLASTHIVPPYTEPERLVVVGDPQASLQTFLCVLAEQKLLSQDGWLVPTVQLVSVGDHFDWGTPEQRDHAASDGLALLHWLSAHAPEHVTLIAGNHDLARVGELAEMDGEQFITAHREALLAYRSGSPDSTLEAAFLIRYPQFPSAELAARDFAAFAVAQRELVTGLLQSSRFRLAKAIDDRTLVCHAGITQRELDAVGYAGESHRAHDVATAINARFEVAIAEWNGLGRLSVEALHTPGDAQIGEGGGMLYHRPANQDVVGEPESFVGPGRRRYDPRTLPAGLTQVVGHISDAKCRKFFGAWAIGEAAPGRLRNLVTDGTNVRYQVGAVTSPRGLAHEARLIFVDGEMNRVPAAEYEVLVVRSSRATSKATS